MTSRSNGDPRGERLVCSNVELAHSLLMCNSISFIPCIGLQMVLIAALTKTTHIATCKCVVSYSVTVHTMHTVYVILVFFLPPDTSLTPHLLLPAVSTVRDFWGGDGLLRFLGVPYSVRDQIRQDPSYSSEDERRIAVLQYCLQTVPGMSWGMIAGVLWYKKEHTALETVRPYLPHKPGDYTIWYMYLYDCV